RELEVTAQQLTLANDRLRQLDVQKDEFLSQVSHELRTPMTSIRSFSEILLDPEPVSPEESRRFVAIINQESQRLTRLLDEILDISRLEAGAVDLPTGPVDVAAAVGSALDAVSPIARKAGVEIGVAVGEGLTVEANADRLSQALINLLGNAIKYNPAAAPRIDVRA
ncbi:MAG: histidine kinase dimerization/phospho-acceptor domain-containing protein, partial [Alphaproteobacteria bacterium]